MYAHISAVHGKNIYLTCEFEEAFPYGTYVYNISKKKVIKKIKDCKITDIGGDYLVSSTNAFGSELILYRFTPEGLEKVKKLCNFGISRGFSKNKLYYVNYPVKSQYGDFYEDKRAEIYCCNKDGTGEKKLAVLENAEGKMVQKITSSYCTYWDNRVTYKYTYKTKKIKKISGR